MTLPTERICRNCKWWVLENWDKRAWEENPYKVNLYGPIGCRRKAPIGNDANDLRIFPRTQSDDFCGEWEQRPFVVKDETGYPE